MDLREKREANRCAIDEFNRVKRAKLDRELAKPSMQTVATDPKADKKRDRERANRASAAASRAKLIFYSKELERRTDRLEMERNAEAERANRASKKLAALRDEVATLRRVLRELWDLKDQKVCAYLIDSDALFLLSRRRDEEDEEESGGMGDAEAEGVMDDIDGMDETLVEGVEEPRSEREQKNNQEVDRDSDRDTEREATEADISRNDQSFRSRRSRSPMNMERGNDRSDDERGALQQKSQSQIFQGEDGDDDDEPVTSVDSSDNGRKSGCISRRHTATQSEDANPLPNSSAVVEVRKQNQEQRKKQLQLLQQHAAQPIVISQAALLLSCRQGREQHTEKVREHKANTHSRSYPSQLGQQNQHHESSTKLREQETLHAQMQKQKHGQSQKNKIQLEKYSQDEKQTKQQQLQLQPNSQTQSHTVLLQGQQQQLVHNQQQQKQKQQHQVVQKHIQRGSSIPSGRKDQKEPLGCSPRAPSALHNLLHPTQETGWFDSRTTERFSPERGVGGMIGGVGSMVGVVMGGMGAGRRCMENMGLTGSDAGRAVRRTTAESPGIRAGAITKRSSNNNSNIRQGEWWVVRGTTRGE